VTRYSPDDPAFNRVVRDLIEVMYVEEKLVFITTDNQVAEVIYASEFGTDEPMRIRTRLERAERLKGIVHVSALHVGQRNTTPKISVVEYLPNKKTYHIRFVPQSMTWEPAEYEDADQNYKELWREENT
jgi:hypothetical protein